MARDQAGPVIGLIGEVGRVQRQVVALYGLMLGRVVNEGQLNTGGGLAGHQPALDALLGRHFDPGIAFDHRLARQDVTGSDVFTRKSHGGPRADRAPPAAGATRRGVINQDCAAAAAALATTRLVQMKAGQDGGVDQQSPGRDLHLDISGLEVNRVVGQDGPPGKINRSRSRTG